MRHEPASMLNPEPCQADFTYSISPTKLVIKDTGQVAKTVLEDMPAVLRRIEYWHQGSVDYLKLLVLDPEGRKVYEK
jgi:hypothetical protein